MTPERAAWSIKNLTHGPERDEALDALTGLGFTAIWFNPESPDTFVTLDQLGHGEHLRAELGLPDELKLFRWCKPEFVGGIYWSGSMTNAWLQTSAWSRRHRMFERTIERDDPALVAVLHTRERGTEYILDLR